jgi:molecular chaperone DnaK
MAYVPDDGPEIIENAEGKPTTPSVVHITDRGESQVGEGAQDMMVMKPEQSVSEIKKQMGENVTVSLGEDEYTPQEVSALILQKLVADAEDRLGSNVTNAVITVPAYFTDRERTATREAGEMAGLEVEKLLAEPSAAVLAYGLREQRLGDSTEETVFVYDLGGGTFDATLVDADYEGNYIETIATDGDSSLGGSDWTEAIADWTYDAIADDIGIDLRENSAQEEVDSVEEARKRVVKTARDAKHRLSEQQEVNVTIPYIVPSKGYNFDATLTREEFERMTADLFDRTTEPMDAIFERTEYTTEDVDKVLLIGGATRMPRVEELVEEYFGMAPSKEISPDKAVALGAAIQAAVLDEEVTTVFSEGDEADESGGSDGSGGLVIIEALSQSVGVEVQPDGRFDPIIERDTSLPATERKEGYGVQYADQTSVEIQVYQGENEDATKNEFLGRAIISDIPPREPGDPSLAVEFTINEDGTLEVRGEDLQSDKGVSTTIESGLDTSSETDLPPNA